MVVIHTTGGVEMDKREMVKRGYSEWSFVKHELPSVSLMFVKSFLMS